MTDLVPYGRALSQLARRHPDRVALVEAHVDGDEQPVSFAELERRANQLGRLLATRGVGQGSLVAVALPNSAKHFFATHAAWKLGASVLPMRWDLPQWERQRLLELAKPVAVVADWDDEPSELVTSSDIARSQTLSAAPHEDRYPDARRVIASSGSTGTPKLIISPGPATIELNPPVRRQYSVGEGVVQLLTSPLYHTNGFGVHMQLLHGGMVVAMEKFSAARAAELIERHRVTDVILVPTMLQRIIALDDIAQRDLSSLTSVYYGGAPLAARVARAWLDLIGADRFFFQYGGTESLGLTMASGSEWLEHEGTVGRGVDCDLRIVDDDDRELPVGTVGEIMLRRFDRAESFRYIGSAPPRRTSDGYTTYGDLGWLDADGYLYIADRRVDMVVTGGANVFPAEVEQALGEHPGVADVVVIGVPDPEWGRRLHAIVEPVDIDNPPDDDELRRFTKSRLASYKVPKTIEVVSQIPRTAIGKVNRQSLTAERDHLADQVAERAAD